MQIFVFLVFAVLCIGSLVRPLWAVVLALLMYPLEQSLQGSVPVFRAFPPLANLTVALVVGTAAILAVLRMPRPFLGYFTVPWWIIMIIHFWMTLSLLWTPAGEVAGEITRDGLPYFILFVVCAPLVMDELADIQSFARLFLVFGTLTALSIVVNPEFSFQYGRLGLDIVGKVRTSPLAMGEMGGALVILAVLYRGSKGHVFLTLIRVAGFLVGAALALYSGSRGQILFAGFVAMICFPISRHQRSLFSYFGTMIGVIMFAGALVLVASFVLEGDMLQRWSANQLTRGAEARELNFTELFRAWFEHPPSWVFGLGFNAFTAVTTASNEPYSHSIVLDVLCELGAPLFALFVVLMWMTFQASRRLFNAVKRWPTERAAVTILIAFAIYQFMLSNKQGMLWTSGPLFLHWLLLIRMDTRVRTLELVHMEEPHDDPDHDPEAEAEGEYAHG